MALNLSRIRKKLRKEYLEDIEGSRDFKRKTLKTTQLGSTKLEELSQAGQNRRALLSSGTELLIARGRKKGALNRAKLQFGLPSGLPQARSARTGTERGLLDVERGKLGVSRAGQESRERGFDFLRSRLRSTGAGKIGTKNQSPENRKKLLDSLFDSLIISGR